MKTFFILILVGFLGFMSLVMLVMLQEIKDQPAPVIVNQIPPQQAPTVVVEQPDPTSEPIRIKPVEIKPVQVDKSPRSYDFSPPDIPPPPSFDD